MRIGEISNAFIFRIVPGTLMLLTLPSLPFAADKDDACVASLWPAAKSAGVKRDLFDRAFAGFIPDPDVVEAANYQPEYVKPIGEYIDRLVSEKRIETGKQMLIDNKALLDQIEARYGVDRHIIVAIWGVESNYGTEPGDKNVIRSLATLYCTGTKPTFAKPQIITALEILQHGDITLEAMNGSWAGAMGQTQFIPTTYTKFAVDADGDGKRDIWTDIADALASTANYLRYANWQPGQTWGYEVKVPKGLDPKRVSETTMKALAAWQRLGFVRVDGEPFPRPADKATFFAPEGARGPSFLVLNNFRAILHYNTAKSYALAVGHLSDRLRGGRPFVHSWPTDETHLALDQRIELQQLLLARGYMTGEADGVIGRATLEAVKAYQCAKGIAVDGFPSLTILKLLRSESQSG